MLYCHSERSEESLTYGEIETLHSVQGDIRNGFQK